MRYRKLDTHTWADAKFLALSPQKPSGQTLWLYLLLGPHNTSLPGLFVAGEAGLAEALGWPLLAFRRAFSELSARHMVKADWLRRVVWIPRSLRYNYPESPNVVRSWRVHLDAIPECDLKREACLTLAASIREEGDWGVARGQIFADLEPLIGPKASGKASGKPRANQEQEQEQEQEGEPPLPPRGGKRARPPRSKRAGEEESQHALPPELDSDHFRQVWSAWLQDRRERGKRLTPTQSACQLRKLAGMGQDRAIAALEHTMLQGYTGIVEPRPAEQDASRNGKPDALDAAFARYGQPKAGKDS